MGSRKLSVLCVVLVACMTGVVTLAFKSDPPPEPPYPLWRGGQLLQIRNCERPASEEDLLLCASFYCEQAVSMKMPAPQQATLTTETRRRLPETGRIRISGTIDFYQVRSHSLPYGYECVMDRYNRVVPELLFRSRPG